MHIINKFKDRETPGLNNYIIQRCHHGTLCLDLILSSASESFMATWMLYKKRGNPSICVNSSTHSLTKAH